MGLFENFPYTNFHEINLDQIIKIMRQMQDEWQQVESDWDSMQDFINNYFDNLDVSEEVLQALQTMAGDGELNTIIDPVIVAETASWLAEHITPTSPAVDNTLSIAGAAADAKATGDAVADLKEDLRIPSPMEWEYNDHYYINTSSISINTTNPYTYSASYHGKSKFVPCAEGDVFIISIRGNSSNLKPYIFCDSEGTIIDYGSDIQYINERIVAPENTSYVGFNSIPEDTYGTVQIGEPAIDEIEYEIDSINNIIGTSRQMSWAYTRNYYIKTDVTSIDTSNPYSYSNSYFGKCRFMACNPGDVFVISLFGDVSNLCPYVICSSDGTVIEKGSINNQYHDYRLVIPETGAYIGFNSVPSDAYGAVQIGETNIELLNAKVEELENIVETGFTGLNGVAFGTSLTYRAQTTGGYLQYLPSLSGITWDNQGIGSSKIKGNMLTAIQEYTNYSDKNVCILEGFVNDWWENSAALGTWEDTTDATVCGCVRTAINHIITHNANITLFLVLDPYGRNYNGTNNSSTAVNNAGSTQYEFYEEIAKVAESLAIPVIKLYAISGISENTPQYIMDNIHPTALGAEQTAYAIWSQMKQYYPNRTA